jgi:hypothetical protein
VGKAAASSGAYFLQATRPSVAFVSNCARRMRPREQWERKGHGTVVDSQKGISRVHVPLQPRPRPHPAPSTPWSVQVSALEKRNSTRGKHVALEGPRAGIEGSRPVSSYLVLSRLCARQRTWRLLAGQEPSELAGQEPRDAGTRRLLAGTRRLLAGTRRLLAGTRRLLAGNEKTGDRDVSCQPKQETKAGRGDRRREANASRGKTNARRGKGSGTGSGKGKGKEAWYRET